MFLLIFLTQTFSSLKGIIIFDGMLFGVIICLYHVLAVTKADFATTKSYITRNRSRSVREVTALKSDTG